MDESILRIVVIDDSEFSRRATVEILESNGYKVVGEAGNAESAFSLINNSKANLYIIDVVMPEVSGLELAKNISEKVYKKRFLNYYRLSFLIFLITAIPIYLFAEYIIVLLFGYAYQPAGILLSLMAIRLFFTNSGVSRGSFINIENPRSLKAGDF